jgi:tetratricopeptide (TPR) repeat protein
MSRYIAGSQVIHLASRTILSALLLTGVPIGLNASAFAQQSVQRAVLKVGGYYDIVPGVSTRAQVELRYGEPVKRLSPTAFIYQYDPPQDDADTDRLVIAFDPNTQQVVRVDAYLKTFLPSDVFRAKFATRIASRERPEGSREEFYYPQYQALIYADSAPDAPVLAVSFVSPYALAGVFVRRFEDALERKSYEEARTEADKAVAVDPAGGDGYNAQGRLFAAMGDLDEAIVRFTAAANSSNGHDRHMAHLWMARLYETQKKMPDRAKSEYLAAIDSAPQSDRSDARLAYSRFLKAQGRADESLAELVKAVAVQTTDEGEARRVLAETYWEKGDVVAALPQYEVLARIADANPEDVRNAMVYFRYGIALRQGGKPILAAEAYEKSRKADPQQVAPITRLALIYMEEGEDPAKAVELYREALKLAPNDHAINRDLIDALFYAGRVDEARQQAGVTLTLKPDDPATLFALARCWGALKNKKEALHWVQRAVEAGFNDQQLLNADPALDIVRDDRAFKRLIQPKS